jgi:DNA-binding LacI/PurR family transcriptional regulator
MNYCAQKNYYVKLFSYAPNQESISRIFEERPAGIVCRSVSPEAFELLTNYADSYKTPVLSLSFNPEYAKTQGCFLIADEIEGGRKAFEHLLNLGHKNIGIVATDKPQSRETYFIKASSDAGYIIKEKNIIRLKNNHREHLIPLIQFFERSHDITAFFCVTDYHALRLIQAAYELNIKIPKDFSVVGVSGLSVGEYSAPSLTSLAIKDNIGTRAGEKIFDMIDTKIIPYKNMQVEKMPMELIIRNSTGTARNNKIDSRNSIVKA